MGAGVPGADEVRGQALEVARGWSPPGAPWSWQLTAALFEAIAADDDLLGLLGVLPADRLPALLGSAAIAFLVRRDRPAALAGYFPEPGAAQPRFDEAFFPAFRAFCATHLDGIAGLCQRRRYQMNEVARCAQIVLGIAAAGPDPSARWPWSTWAPGPGSDCSWTATGTASGPDLRPAGAGLTLPCEVRGPRAPRRPPCRRSPPGSGWTLTRLTWLTPRTGRG